MLGMNHGFARRSVVITSCVIGAVGLLFACTVEEENPGTPSKASTSDSGSGPSTSADGQAPVTNGELCAARGGYEKIRVLARAVIDGATADCRVAPMFNDLLGDQGAAEHTRGCFEQFFGASLKCAGVSFAVGTSEAAGKKCESPLPNLTFSAKDWQAFGDFNANPPCVAVKILTSNGFTTDDLRVVGPIFEGLKTGLIDGELDPAKYTQCSEICPSGGVDCPAPIVEDAGNDAAPPNDAGGETDAGDGG